MTENTPGRENPPKVGCGHWTSTESFKQAFPRFEGSDSSKDLAVLPDVEQSESSKDLALRRSALELTPDGSHLKYSEGWLSDQLLNAARVGSPDMIKGLLKAGADIQTDNGHPLRFAVEGGHDECVEVLLEAGADPRAENDYALRWAVHHDRPETAALLLKRYQMADLKELAQNPELAKGHDLINRQLGRRRAATLLFGGM
jgi:ankyrin repeat protein